MRAFMFCLVALAGLKSISSQDPCSFLGQTGNYCFGCDKVAFCHPDGQGGFMTFIRKFCSSKEVCDAKTFKCVPATAPCTDTKYYKFKCLQNGVFPDPNFCNTYHECDSNFVDTKRTCNLGEVYSVSKKACTTIDICTKPQIECNLEYDAAKWPGSDNLMYICLTDPDTNDLYPALLYYTTALKEGSLIRDPRECHSFFYIGEHVQHYDCPPGTYFDQLFERCIFGTCTNIKALLIEY